MATVNGYGVATRTSAGRPGGTGPTGPTGPIGPGRRAGTGSAPAGAPPGTTRPGGPPTANWTGALLGGLCVVAAAEVLRPLLAGVGWWLNVAATVAVVVLVGQGARRLRITAVLVVLAQLVLSAGWVVVITGTGALRGGLIPTGATPAALDAGFTAAFQVVREAAPPVAVDPSMTLLIAGSFALVAVVVDTVVVTWRIPALTAVLMAAVQVVAMLSAPDGTSALDFAVSAVALVALLLFAPGRGARAGGPWAGQVGLRTGVVAVGLAVLVPLVVPGLGVGAVYQLGSHTATADGSGPVGPGTTFRTGVNPLVAVGSSLRRGQNVPVLTYRTSDGSAPYLRLRTLDTFDGDVWSAARLGNRIPDTQTLDRPAGLAAGVSTTPLTTRVKVADGLVSAFLPVPYPLLSVQADGAWNIDSNTRDVLGYRTGARGGLDYSATSLEVAPTPAQLRAAAGAVPDQIRRLDLALPSGLPAVVAATAREQTAGLGNDFDRATALQDWFRSPAFTYDISVPGASANNAIAEFLRTRRGFCQQFAGTMAVMARTLGIPARVVTGFLPGTSNGDGTTTVSAYDAHAWPELWFSGIGWVRFEPTPSGQAPLVPDYTAPSSAPVPSVGLVAPAPPPVSGPLALETTPSTGTAAIGRSRVAVLVTAAVALAVLLVLFGPHLLVVLRRRRRSRAATRRGPAAVVEFAWEQLRSALVEQGAGWDAAASPRATARRIAEVVARSTAGGDAPAGTTAVTAATARLVAAAEQVRYAGPDVPGGIGTGTIHTDTDTVVRALRSATTRRSRVTGYLFPEPLRRLPGGG